MVVFKPAAVSHQQSVNNFPKNVAPAFDGVWEETQLRHIYFNDLLRVPTQSGKVWIEIRHFPVRKFFLVC